MRLNLTPRFARSKAGETFLEKEEPPVIQPSLEDLLRPETEEEDALSLAEFDDEQ